MKARNLISEAITALSPENLFRKSQNFPCGHKLKTEDIKNQILRRIEVSVHKIQKLDT
jgi:hypothetical protein